MVVCLRYAGFRYPVESYQRLGKLYMLFPCLAFITLGKSMGVKHRVLPDGQPQIISFTVLAQLCGGKGNETGRCATLFSKAD